MWLDIQIFGFRALWSPYFFTFLLLITLTYFLVTGPLRHKFGGEDKPTRNQQLFFYSAILLTYLVKGSPVDLMSHIMMSFHMAQTAVLYFVVPIFIIRGLPIWMLEKFTNIPIVKLLMKFFTQPLIALILFNALFAMYHLPDVFDYTKSNLVAHSSITIVLFVLALTMWWPIVTPLDKYDVLNPLLKFVYLIGSILIISIACALMIFSKESVYAAYGSDGAWLQAMSLCVPADVLNGLADTLSGAEMFSPLSAAEDQQLGGIIMMFLQQIFYGFVLAWIFFGWFSAKNMEIDPMPDSLPQSDR
ncbi:MAG TPA: cytochrome c oxidase assembly factor CtaG [Pseudogracilibacillus sp.]|nr:cytochrome c oxidase assembly factor CtaG [Pseudogracilibacillus sp.]